MAISCAAEESFLSDLEIALINEYPIITTNIMESSTKARLMRLVIVPTLFKVSISASLPSLMDVSRMSLFSSSAPISSNVFSTSVLLSAFICLTLSIMFLVDKTPQISVIMINTTGRIKPINNLVFIFRFFILCIPLNLLLNLLRSPVPLLLNHHHSAVYQGPAITLHHLLPFQYHIHIYGGLYQYAQSLVAEEYSLL